MTGEEHPCTEELTPECFEKYPAWAKQAFAYRLMHTLFPPWLTRRLPKFLRLALIGEGAILPPGFIPPEGSIIPPNCTFSPGWSPIDPLPPGVTTDPAANIITPPGGVLPPFYVELWEPGPVHRPTQGPAEVENTFTSENDGIILQRQPTWAAAQGAAIGLNIYKTDERSNVAIRARREFINKSVHRTFLEFDLSGVPAGKTITEAKIDIYVYSYGNCNGSLQEGTQSDSLLLADYDNFTGNPFNTIAMTEGAKTFTLNAAGRTFIESKFSKKAKFCIREYDHDCLNVQPGMDQNFRAGMYYSETEYEDKKPTLTVEYE